MFAAKALAVVSLAVAAHVAYAADCARTYTIKEGDYCDKISAANNVSTYQLAAINPGVINPACDNLAIGGELCLGTKDEDCKTTYVVSAGDSCSKIWDGARVNSTIFSLNNPQVNEDCTNIYVGEVLCVANEVLAPPRPNVPIHTGPPEGVPQTQPPVAQTTTPSAPATTVAPAPGTTAPPQVAPAPATTKAPVPAAPASSAAPGHDHDDDEDCEEWEIVEGDTDEDIPFCDEVDVDV